MRSLPVITDPVYTEKLLTTTDRFFVKFIKDKRDLPFIYLLIKICLILIPLAVLLYTDVLQGWQWWTLAIVYQVINFIFRAPYGLMIHCISHRQIFKKQFKSVYHFIIWCIGPFLGHTPETYFSHHMGMHHVENNMPEDESSTMGYKRDSFLQFLKYEGLFLVSGFANLMVYLGIRKRKRMQHFAFAGELAFFIFCIAMCFINFKATMMVFVTTFIISRLIAMVGNWTQHAFVDPDDPANPYKNAITCINVKYNHKCWNDGYHTSHHERPALHWTEHPKYFMEKLDEYAANKALIFDRADFGKIIFYLLQKKYDVLAKHVVNINGSTFANDEEIIELLKHRTQKFNIKKYKESGELILAY